MNTSIIERDIIDSLEKLNFKIRFFALPDLDEIKKEYQKIKDQLDKEFCEQRLSFYSFNSEGFDAKSLIITAAVQYPIKVYFTYNNNKIVTTIPPTYSNLTDNVIRETIKKIITPFGYSIEKALLPEKLLAVYSGMAKYGRNNITYVNGWGSYARIRIFFSDLPSTGKMNNELVLMERCKNCTACIKCCPTGALSNDRFIIHAEKCLTYLNESKKDFPQWLDPSFHHCLVGCMKCQQCCPVNHPFKNVTDSVVEFEEKETLMFSKEIPYEHLPVQTAQKINSLKLEEEYSLVARNLRALLKSKETV